MPKNSPFFIDIGQGLSLPIGLPTISCWNTIGRPKNVKIGIIGFNLETNSLEFWSGLRWSIFPMTKIKTPEEFEFIPYGRG